MKFLVKDLSRSRFQSGISLRAKECAPHVVIHADDAVPLAGEIFDSFRADQPAAASHKNSLSLQLVLPSQVISRALSRFRCDCQQTIPMSESVSEPEYGKQNAPREEHEKQCEESVPHLAGLLALPRKKVDEERLCDP